MRNKKNSKRLTVHSFKPTGGSWWADKLLQVLTEMGIEPFLEKGSEMLRRRRTVDFFITPGSISGRIQDEQKRSFRAKFIMPVIPDQKWEFIFETFARQALFPSTLLAGEFPLEIEEVLRDAGEMLYPEEPADLQTLCDCGATRGVCEHIASLFLLMRDHTDRNPFSVLTFRGCGKEKLLLELRLLRNSFKKSSTDVSSLSYQKVSYQPAPPLAATIDHYWSMDKKVRDLSFKIKADELPASLMRRLDPLPFGDLQTYVELALEDVYAKVARRAQALGLGLK